MPAVAELGDYEVWLGVPDSFAATQGDPRFAVRFANADKPDGLQAWSASQALTPVALGRAQTHPAAAPLVPVAA